MNYAHDVKRELWGIIEEMSKTPWLFSRNPEKDFQRKKKWDFELIMKFMLTMEGKSIKKEIFDFFKYDMNTPTNSSFNQRREQILPEAFEFLFHEFSKLAPENNKTFKGYRLIACDGSELNIARNPKDADTYFQTLPTDKGHNILLLNAFYDLCSRCYLDAVIQKGIDWIVIR